MKPPLVRRWNVQRTWKFEEMEILIGTPDGKFNEKIKGLAKGVRKTAKEETQ